MALRYPCCHVAPASAREAGYTHEQLCNRSCSNKHTHPRSLVRDERTHPHRPRLVVSHSTCPPLSSSPPREQLCNRSCSNKHTHTIHPREQLCIGPAVINTHRREEPGKTGAPCVKVPGSSRVTVLSRSTCPPLSRANSFVIGTAVISTHTVTNTQHKLGARLGVLKNTHSKKG